MASNCFSIASFRNGRLQKAFASAGLDSKCLDVDEETTMHCWVPRTSSPTKPCLVLIHGFGTNAMWQWYPQIQPFQENFNVYVPDLVFFGLSNTRSYERSELFQARAVMRLLGRLDVAKFSMIGTSYGGFVAYNLAHLYPEAVEKVVIASSAVCNDVQANEQLLQRAQLPAISDLLLPHSPANLRTLMKLSLSKPPSMIPNFLLNDFIDVLYVENRAEKKELLAGMIIGTKGAPPLPVLKKEVLIVWGEHDQIFPVEMAFQLKKHLGEQAKLVVMKNTSHVPHIENPKEFNRIAKNFLLHHDSILTQ